MNTDYYDEDNLSNTSSEIIQPSSPLNLLKFTRNNCICGHFGHHGYYIDTRYPQVFNGIFARYRFKVFTFLRDPLKMRCSLFRHQKKFGINNFDDLNDAICTYNNYYARIFNVDETNFQKKLDQYFYVGLMDNLQASFDTLANLLSKPPVKLPAHNVSQSLGLDESTDLTQKQVSYFKKINYLDYQIYEYVKKKFELSRIACTSG